MNWQVDDRVGGGKFKLLRKRGEGTYGEVWEAEDVGLHRKRALKRLFRGVEKIKIEAQMLSKLEHKNIVRFYEYNEKGSFYVMEYVEGKSLQEILEECKDKNSWITEPEKIIRYCLEALKYAHEKGVTHGDIKPGNIIVPSLGERYAWELVKLTDFGVARPIRKDLESDSLLSSLWSEIQGKPSLTYGAPEILEGKLPDKQSDLFSLGIIAYLLLAKSHPFVDPSGIFTIPRLIEKWDYTPPYDKIPEEWRGVIQKLLERDKEKRYSSAGQVLDDLSNILRKEKKLEEEEAIELPAEKPVKKPRTEADKIREVLSIATALYNNRQADQAINKISSLLSEYKDKEKKFPELFSKAHTQLGFYYNHKGKFGDGVEQCENAIQLKPTSYAYGTMGYALYNQGKYSEAENAFTRALSLAKDKKHKSQLLYQRARTRMAQGKQMEAETDLYEALRLDPNNSKAKQLLAEISIDRKRET